MNLTRKVGLIALCGLLAAAPLTEVIAQTPAPATAAEQNYDPIVSALDSLVTLNHVVRYNSLESNCFDSNVGCSGNVPKFSDEEYRERMSLINSPIPLSYNIYVKNFIDLYAVKKRGLTQRAMGLSNLYFPMYEEVMDREGIPLEFKYLSIVESALNPVAVSKMGATGLWQFMYGTGIMYNLKVNSYTDDRRDPYKATVAACQYFKDMYKIYNDWLLVIAAYNCGAGNVNKAIKRSGGKTNFWEIMTYLPQETRGYVPAFIAVTYVMNYSREHQLYPVSPAYSYFEVDTIQINRQISFKALSNALNIPIDVISYLNPIYKKNIIPEAGIAYTLRLPSNKISMFIANEEAIYLASAPAARPVLPDYFASRSNDNNGALADNSDSNDIGTKYQTISKKVKKSYTVKRGENLSSIADRYDMTSTEIRKMNHLKSVHLKAGQKLMVYTVVKTKVAVKEQPVLVATSKKDSGSTSVTGQPTPKDSAQELTNNDSTQDDQATIKVATVADKKPKYIYHMVLPGDTLWNIAKRYEGVTVEMIKDINNLRNANIKPGTRLKVILNS
ncbi:hypothetical protein BH11BAC2_BH11BAC2_16970 [soil metagenome]